MATPSPIWWERWTAIGTGWNAIDRALVVIGPFWLIGMMGSGKSAVGRALATRFGVEFVDTDDAVAKSAGLSVPDMWEQMGEQHFRTLEQHAIEQASQLAVAVVATGGGVVLHQPSVTLMRRTGLVVWLDAPPDTLARRVGLGEGRPLLASPDRLARLTELAEIRRPRYEAAAHYRLDTEGRTITDVVNELDALWTA